MTPQGSLKSLLWGRSCARLPLTSSTPTDQGLVQAIFLWRQSLTLGHVWMKAPVGIQVPRLRPSVTVHWTVSFYRIEAIYPGAFNLKTSPAPFLEDLSWQPSGLSHKRTSSISPWNQGHLAGLPGCLQETLGSLLEERLNPPGANCRTEGCEQGLGQALLWSSSQSTCNDTKQKTSSCLFLFCFLSLPSYRSYSVERASAFRPDWLGDRCPRRWQLRLGTNVNL